MKKFGILFVLLAGLATLIAGCGGQKAEGISADKVIKVGVTAGPHAEVVDEVKRLAEKQGLKIQVVEFSDYIQPNVALSQKEIDINSMQHQPFLDVQIKDRKYDIVSVGKSILLPMAIYSNQFKSIEAIPNGATVGIPNDPTNEGRALLLLQSKGLIKLKPDAGLSATPKDIAENPRNLKFKELEAAQVPRSLNDLDVAVINTNYAIPAGLNPKKDSIGVESLDSPYANVIVVRTADKDNPVVKKFVAIYQSAETRKLIEERFQGTILPAF